MVVHILQAMVQRKKSARTVDRHREKDLIEIFSSKLKPFRKIATRKHRLAENVLTMPQLRSMRLWLRAYESTA